MFTQSGVEVIEPRCEDCPLNGSIKVFGEGTDGDTTYDIVGVGIAPAREEVKQKRPLVGWSGTLLRKTLKKLGITEFWLTNVLLCELPEDISESKQKLAIDCCRARLLEEVKSRSPSLILALGNTPLEVLTGIDYKIRSVSGRILPGIIGNVLPVIHPASLRRRPDEFYDFLTSLKTIGRYRGGTYQQAVIPETIIVNEENLPELCQRIENVGLVSVDLETTGKGYYPYGQEPDKIRCIVLAMDNKTAYIVPGESSPYYEPHPNLINNPNLVRTLNKVKCIFHNGQFDCGFLLQAGYKPRVHFDTMLAHYTMDERPYVSSLKKLASKYLGAPDWEEDIKEFLPHKSSSYDLIPDDKLYQYASHDVIYTHQLYEEFEDKVPEFYYKLLLPATNMFIDIRHRGLRVDVGILMQTDEILDKELNQLIDDLCSEIGYYINPFSPYEVAELLYDKLEMPKIPRFGRSTAVSVLNNLPYHPVIEKIKEIRELGKLKSTYVVSLANFLDSNFRIHPFLKLYGTVTGRLSAEDPSILNIVKREAIKRMYLPEKEHYLLEVDQKQMELRWAALVTEDPKLREVLASEDPHGVIGEMIKKMTGREWERDKYKAAVFGVIYGRGLESLMFQFGIGREDAKYLMDSIKSLLPSLEKYKSKIKGEVHSKGYLTSYFGRRRRFGLLTPENIQEVYRMGYNFPIQSAASDTNLYCMLHLYENRSRYGILPLFPVHDSIIMDIEDLEAIPTLKKEIEEYCGSLVDGKMDYRVEIKVGPNWGETKPWQGG